MAVQASMPVVRVPVLSNAIVLQLAKASSTLPPWIRIPLQSCQASVRLAQQAAPP